MHAQSHYSPVHACNHIILCSSWCDICQLIGIMQSHNSPVHGVTSDMMSHSACMNVNKKRDMQDIEGVRNAPTFINII